VRRLLVVVLALLLLTGAAPAQAQPCSGEGCLPVVVVGVPGLRWSDVGPETPTLQRLSREGASGALSVKAVPAVTCPADGWLTLGAGNRAAAAGIRRDPCGDDLPEELGASLRDNARLREGAELGVLARALDGCIVTTGPGPELAAGFAADDPPRGCPLVLAAARPVAGTGTARAGSAVAADRAVEQLVDGGGRVLVVGLSEGPGDATAHLHVAIAHGPGFAPGALRSASTRRQPYVQLVDVAPTVLALLGRGVPPSMTGEPWRSVGEPPTPAELADVDDQAVTHKRVTVPFFVALLGGELLLLLALWRRRPDAAERVALGGVAVLGTSYLANLLPWWRTPAPLLTLLGGTVLLAAGVVALAMARRRASPLWAVGVVCACTAGVLVLDLLTGARLQMSSVAGYSPLVAGRFAGIGNVAFGVLAASVLLATAALTRSLRAVAAVAAVAVAVDGAPPWGSDVGGVLALVPAFVLLAMLLSGRRVTLLRLAAAGLAGAAVVTAFALVDWGRPAADRTHLGRFVQDVVDGTAGTLLRRKAEAVLGLVFSSPLTTVLSLVVLSALVLVVARPPRPLADALEALPAWRAGLVATGLAGGIGFAVNDSGAAVPAMALTVAVPATAAVVLRARRTREDSSSLLA
jgi:hypothetical protein